MQSFDKQFVVWLMSRNGGKSTLSAPFIMTKMMLFPNFESYILSTTSAQSQDTFLKMEKIAKRQIESFTGLTDIYFNEIVKSASNSDGFTHSPQGFKYELYNGSRVISLSGEENNIRGKRSNLNVYDESGWVTENYAVTTGAFCLQNADFKLGKNLDMELLPKNIPNQLLFCSSASSVDSYFYSIYKEWSKMMFAGSKNHFVADLDCEVIINATNHGKKLYVPLLTIDKVDDAMRQNKEKALKILRARLYEQAEAERAAGIAEDRKSQVGTGDRSERIRTYNYPQGRVTDHRIGLTLYKLESFLDGDLDEVINALITADQAEKMKKMGNTEM